MDFETIILRKEGGIATITLNRPEKLNAVDDQMLEDLIAALDDIAGDGEVRVLVITGAGRAFCSGRDMGGMEKRTGQVIPVEERRQIFRRELKIILGLQKLEKPTIAMVNGVCVGGGFELALGCDLRVGSQNARFICGFTRLGLIPGWGGTYLWPRIMGLGKALEVLFTGDPIEAEEAERIGVLNRLVPVDELERETMKLARKIASNPPVGIRLSKMLVYKGLWMDMETAMEFAVTAETIAVTSEDHKEAVSALREKREGVYRGR